MRQPSIEKLWQEGMKNASGMIPSRMINDDEEEQFWQQHITNKSATNAVDSYAVELSDYLLSYIDNNYTVLEIGPGWGNYTFSLAKKASSLLCVEPSESCVRFLKERGVIENQPISFVQQKWEDYQSDEQVDIVVGMNCFYRMFEIKHALEKINYTAKKKAIIGMTTAPMRPHYLDLEREYGVELIYPKRDYVHLLHLLYELGIYANCTMVPIQRTYCFSSYEDVVLKNSAKLINKEFDRKKIEQSLQPYITEEQGVYYYSHSFYAALIDWVPS